MRRNSSQGWGGRIRPPVLPCHVLIHTYRIHRSPTTGYLDELAWAALFLHKATEEARYLQAAESLYASCCSAATTTDKRRRRRAEAAFSWDNKAPGVQLLLYNATGNARYADDVAAFLNSWRREVPRTPGGLAFFTAAPLQYAASASFLALVAAEQGIDAQANRRFAQGQLHYMLGLERSGPGDAAAKQTLVAGEAAQSAKVWSNITASAAPSADVKQSFLVGYGSKSPRSPAHRASSCQFQRSNTSCRCSDRPGNFFVLFGALVGGPLPDDSYADDCQNVEANAVSLVGNAGFTSAVAGLKQLAMRMWS